MKSKFSKFLLCKIMGWQIKGNLDPTIKKSVIAVVTHTSWHDFYIGLLVRSIIKHPINFVGKKELFIFPFVYFFKWLGGAPLDRSGNNNKVDAIAAEFDKHDTFRVAMSPEGTRKKVDKLRTGFYFIAKKANVPLIPVAFDFKTKTVTIYPALYLTDDIDADIKKFESHFIGVVGKIPEYSFEVKP
jgi:1-acyl-sn-glycerol-3-phosphate acyltransferase